MKLEKRTWRNLGITLLVVSIFSLAVPLIYLSFFVEAAPVEISTPVVATSLIHQVWNELRTVNTVSPANS
jgi:hypothetical protein